jgi:ribose transport system substrate-binding protein
MKFKKSITLSIVAALMLSTSSLIGCANTTTPSTHIGSLQGSKSEDYYMVTFLSGIEYWKGCYKGFQDSGKLYGVTTVYTGANKYDVNQEVTVLDQIIAKNPAGIAVSCMNPDALKVPIQNAIKAGIPVVTFDSDSPDSGRYSFLGTGNEAVGELAAKTLAQAIGSSGQVALITLPGQLNHDERSEGFKNEISNDFKNIQVVETGNGKGDQTLAAEATSAILEAHPDITGIFCTDATSGVGVATAVKEAGKAGKIKIVSFDTDNGTLSMIKQGIITSSIAQGTYSMGFQSMNFLFELQHNLSNPVNGWKAKGISPLPASVDTGASVVTKSNVDSFES